MRYINNDKGVTLIEMMIVLALMMIAIGIVSLSTNNINYARLDATVKAYETNLKKYRESTIYSARSTYQIIWGVETGKTYYKIVKKDLSVPPMADQEIEKVYINSDIVVTKDGTLIPSITDIDKITIEYNQSTGEVITGGFGTYSFKSTVLNQSQKVVLTEKIGRAYVDD